MDTIKEFLQRKTSLVLAVIMVIILIMAILSIPPKKPTDPQQYLDQTIQLLRQQYEERLREKDVLIAALDKRIAENQIRIAQSEKRYKEISQRIQELQKEKDNVKPPENDEDRKIRFSAVGFPLLDAK